MRKLKFSIDLKRLDAIKSSVVPVIFTNHQFELIQKKFQKKHLTDSERNEFSRAISRKMNAIYSLIGKNHNVFVYGRDKIIRMEQAAKYLKIYSRKFKDKTLILSGSFLYKKKYNDIDLFVISKYDKEDYWEGKVHINYLPEEAYNSVFYASLRKLCVSNKELPKEDVKKIGIYTFISLFQELSSDIYNNKFSKQLVRDYLLQASYIGNYPILDSQELDKQLVAFFTLKNKFAAAQKIFINSMVLSNKKPLMAIKEVITSYNDLAKDYKQHKEYYNLIISTFKEVIFIES